MEQLINLFLDAFKDILALIMPFVIIILLLTIIKMIYRRYKYKMSIFDVLKQRKREVIVDNELMALTLKQLKGNYEVIVADKLNANFVILSSHGIYLLEMCEAHRGNLTGDLKNEKLEWYDDGKFKYIDNPIIRQKHDLKLLKSLFPKIEVKGFIVFGNDVLWDFSYRGKSTLIRTRNVAYKIQELLNLEEPYYNEKEINKIKEYLQNGNNED